jgi:hypothetical protein
MQFKHHKFVISKVEMQFKHHKVVISKVEQLNKAEKYKLDIKLFYLYFIYSLFNGV